jgi:integrase
MIFRHPPGAGHLPPGKTCQSFPPGRLARWHAAGRTLSDRGEHLEDFYACLYYAALRPLEALKLRESDLHLPKKGWGRIDLAASASRAGTAWTDHGTARQERGLKHRTAHETRTIPVPPELVQLLRAHIRRYGTTPDGRIFQTASGGLLQDSGYNEVWTAAREGPSPPPSTGRRWAGVPTTCGTRRCRCG